MDLADEIAYAAHDLEDSLAMGYMSIDEILYEFKISDKYSDAYDTFQEIITSVQKDCSKSKQVTSSEEYSSIIRREITSRIVDKLVRDIKVNCEKLEFQEHALLSEGLKKLVFRSLFRKRNVQLYEKMGDKVISGLHKVYADESFNKDGVLLPVEYRNADNDRNYKRSIIDYISGMMDSFAIDEYKKYFGPNSLEALYPPNSG
jgi:dGTPase